MKEDKSITRAIIEATVERGLREVDEDPQRSIRKLTDMAKQLSNGRFIGEVYSIFQDLLRNEESPYYILIDHLLHHTSRKALKDFGINLGYNSFTRGAKQIRKIEETSDYQIPWAISFILDSKKSDQIPAEEINSLINQGLELGIFTYNVGIINGLSFIDTLIPIFKAHPGCAFMLCLPDEELDPDRADSLAECTNVLSFLKVPGDYNDSNAVLLRGRKAWYGTYGYYNESNASSAMTSTAKDSFSVGSLFILLIAENGTPLSTIEETQKAIKESRMEPVSPTLMFDMYGDALQIKSILSKGRCFFSFTQDGTIHTDRGYTTVPEGPKNLKELLRLVLNKESN